MHSRRSAFVSQISDLFTTDLPRIARQQFTRAYAFNFAPGEVGLVVVVNSAAAARRVTAEGAVDCIHRAGADRHGGGVTLPDAAEPIANRETGEDTSPVAVTRKMR